MAWFLVFLACWSLLGMVWMSSGRGAAGLVAMYRQMGVDEAGIGRRRRVLFVEYLLVCVLSCLGAIYWPAG